MTIDPATATQPRRVTIVAPHTRVDLALPLQATVAEVVLQAVDLVGAEDGASGGAAGGWLLGRLDGMPLEPGRSIAASDIGDGDVLYLTPRSARLPPALFDDVVDAIAVAGIRGDRWTSITTRRTSLAFAGCAAALGVLPLALAGSPWGFSIITAVVIAVLLLLTAGGLSRAGGDSVAGALAGISAVPYGAWGAARAVDLRGDVWPGNAGSMAVAGATTVLLCVLAVVLVGDHLPLFGAGAIGGLAAAAAGTGTVIWEARTASVAAVAAVAAMMTLPALPMLSVRLARLPLPTVPVDMDEFRRDEVPTSGEDMMDRAHAGDVVLRALLGAVCGVVVVCTLVLLHQGGRWPTWLAIALSAALVLRSRQPRSRTQRTILLGSGLIGTIGVAAVSTLNSTAAGRVLWAAVVLVVAGVGFATTMLLPRRGAAPYAGRFLDIVEFIALMALLPLAGAILEVYAWIRALSG
ncbi:MAG: type VII secretion integral membrane protein EccD [Angustibacter sp.]